MKIDVKLKRFLRGDLGVYEPLTDRSAWDAVSLHLEFSRSDVGLIRTSPPYDGLGKKTGRGQYCSARELQ